MTRFRWTLTALAAFAALAFLGVKPASAAEAKDGKTLFTANKCNMCHTITSQGIDVIKDEEAEDEDESKPVDLSDTGSKHDAKWIADWLAKKVEKDGKTHRKKFSGEPADMKALADWLAGLKGTK